MLYIRLTLICKSPQLAPKLRVSHVNLSGPEYEIEYRFYNEAIDCFLEIDNQYRVVLLLELSFLDIWEIKVKKGVSIWLKCCFNLANLTEMEHELKFTEIKINLIYIKLMYNLIGTIENRIFIQ